MCQHEIEICNAGDYAFHAETNQIVLIEQAQPKTTYYCANCGGRLYVVDSYHAKKHFKHHHQIQPADRQRLDETMATIKKSFKKVGDWLQIPEESGRADFIKLEKGGSFLKVKHVSLNAKVWAKTKTEKFYNPNETTLDVLITASNNKKYGFQFCQGNGFDRPERFLDYRKDERLEAVYGVRYQPQTRKWEVAFLIWSRTQDELALTLFASKLKQRLKARDELLNEREEIQDLKTYYYEPQSATYQPLSPYLDDYAFDLCYSTASFSFNCRYATFQANENWLRSLGLIQPSKQLQAAIYQHQLKQKDVC